jgi:F0F1-type ATP synthase epsilon subunit
MLKCTIVSPTQKKVIEGLEGVFLRTTAGAIGVLTGHIAIVTQLREGETARLKVAGGAEIRVRLGASSFFRFEKDEGTVLTEEFTVSGETAAAPATAGPR